MGNSRRINRLAAKQINRIPDKVHLTRNTKNQTVSYTMLTSEVSILEIASAQSICRMKLLILAM